jgi:hypothetical protein
VAAVLLGRLAPGLLRRLASNEPRSWRHPFHLYLHHPSMSAELILRAGGSPRAAAFVRGMAVGADARLQRALTEADDAS